ncbi:MAG: class I SAM-dependent methyltransferase [Candidatus Nealsonbacteria bacterium]|nr:class I SAM-dependent methyltransferase [Candidatus Nealsonbacteria bacterium]
MEDISDLRCVECLSTHLHRSCVAGAPDTKRLRCASCGAEFPVVDGIVRMVPRDSALRAEETAAPAAELDDSLQAEYWEDDGHGFRSPQDPIVRCFAEQRWRYLASRFDVASVRTALDVGCGDGFSTLYAPKHVAVTACDGSLTMLRRHQGDRRLQVDAFRLPFQDRSFDLVFAWELLHHVSEPHRVLAEMGRVSRRWVIACEPNPVNPAQHLFARLDPAHRWVLRFSKRYMLSQAAAASLEVTHFSRGGCLFPNKTPRAIFPLLRRVPYRIPLVGITNCMIARLPQAAESSTAAPHSLPTRRVA